MPKLIRVRLTSAQRTELRERQRQLPAADRVWERLEMVRRADWGARVPTIAARLEVDVQTVRTYLKAFADGGFAALADRPRSGRPPQLRAADLAAVEALLDQDAAGERTWTLRQLTDWLASERGVRISTSRLSRCLRRRRFRWKRTKRSIQHKADLPRQEEKTADLQTLEQFAQAGMVDLQYLDEAGFALTLPTTSSWAVAGTRLRVPYEAPQGRRVNVIGAYCTHGPAAGHLAYRSWAVRPKSRAKKPRTTPEERAAAHGLAADEVGPIDAERLVAFLWQVAGRPAAAGPTWRRARPVVIALDNYSVHTSQTVVAAQPLLAAANVELVYLARYCPEQSGIEPIWNDVKAHQLPIRSFERVADLKHAVDDALAHKAQLLQHAHAKPTNIHRLAA